MIGNMPTSLSSSKKDRSDASNYRPISITSMCSKVVEHILHSQIIKHMEAHDMLTDQQHGFRKRRSCKSQLIITVQDSAAGLHDDEQIDEGLDGGGGRGGGVWNSLISKKIAHYSLSLKVLLIL